MIPDSPPRAQDLMTRDVRVVAEDDHLDSVVDFLLCEGLSNAPVVREHGGRRELVGFISERDCLASMSESLYYSNPARNAAAVMRSHPVCVGPDTELYALCSIFVQHGYRHLPVVDQERGLVGIVSRRDVLRAMRDYERKTLRAMKQEREPPKDLREILNLRFVPESHG